MGRQKQFSVEAALERALEVFWRHGYEGASLADLTEAMGITRPSLYATYGNKEALFHKAFELYETRYLGFLRAALGAQTSSDVVQQVFSGFVELVAGADNPPGCMGTQGALACSTAAAPIKEELERRRTVFESELAERLARAQREGDLPMGESPGDLARFVMVMSCGLAVLGSGGTPRAALMRAAAVAMRAWPATAQDCDAPAALTAAW